MLARIHGWVVLVYAALAMAFFFFSSLPVMILTRSGAMPIWFGRRAWGPWGLWLAGARTEVEPMPALPDGPLIFASNHESALDIWVVFKVLPRSFRFVAKQELFRLPVFGWYMRLGEHIPVDRGNHVHAVQSLRRAGEAVNLSIDPAACIAFCIASARPVLSYGSRSGTKADMAARPMAAAIWIIR
jgi:1-acyl-sn-glycerol-3-phosphate acyltransferase